MEFGNCMTCVGTGFKIISCFGGLSHSQNYWVSGLCQSSGILKTREYNILETGSVSILRSGGRHLTYSVGSLRES
jgi:hypothetical protein